LLQTFQVAFKTTHTLTVKAPLKCSIFWGGTWQQFSQHGAEVIQLFTTDPFLP